MKQSRGMHYWLQNMLGLITPMKYFPKQLLLEYTGEISVGKEKGKKKYRIRKQGQRKRR